MPQQRLETHDPQGPASRGLEENRQVVHRPPLPPFPGAPPDRAAWVQPCHGRCLLTRRTGRPALGRLPCRGEPKPNSLATLFTTQIRLFPGLAAAKAGAPPAPPWYRRRPVCSARFALAARRKHTLCCTCALTALPNKPPPKLGPPCFSLSFCVPQCHRMPFTATLSQQPMLVAPRITALASSQPAHTAAPAIHPRLCPSCLPALLPPSEPQSRLFTIFSASFNGLLSMGIRLGNVTLPGPTTYH